VIGHTAPLCCDPVIAVYVWVPQKSSFVVFLLTEFALKLFMARVTPIVGIVTMLDGDDAEDCPICLDEMSPADLEHPIRCQTRCGYNFCITCIESLITSSKDDYSEASDGNKHVKVFLNCPNCRSDLGSSIRDTLLCRKVHTLKIHSDHQVDLTASEARLQEVIDDPEVQLAIKEAQEREDEFFGKKPQVKQEEDTFSDSFSKHFKEMGVEADVDRGVHQSFIIKKNMPPPTDRSSTDPTLFQGLECAMSKEEQETVTELLTSGDTTKLAGAAEILHGISIRIQNGVPPPKPPPELPKPQVTRSNSIYQLIDESKIAKERAETSKKPADQEKHVLPHQKRRMLKNEKLQNRKAIEKEIAQRAHFMKLHPLPVRMPKYVEFNLQDKKSRSFLPFFMSSADDSVYPLSFCDDIWDGSVIDAFCKLTVTGGGNKDIVVERKICENIGVVNILEGADDDSEDWIGPAKSRVLVASVRSEAGRQGVLKGDVVTHFNGEEFEGTAEDLDAAIKAHTERSNNGMFTLALNAEPSVAEALRRRSML